MRSFFAVRSTRFAVIAGLLLSLGWVAAACREPTEIRLHVSTNVPCTDPDKWKGVAVYVGAPGADVETKAPALTTTTCNAQGQVGSLVVVPSASKDAEVGIKVVAGLSVAPEECAANNYHGCIVARRSVRFTAHDGLDLDVPLTSDCVNVSCDATHTCVNSVCTDSQTATPVMLDPTEPSVRCGDTGIRCPTTGNVCCFTADPTGTSGTGECKPSEECPPTSSVLNCDDSGDCPPLADGGIGTCAMSYTYVDATASHVPDTVASSQCVSSPDFTLELCQDRKGCMSPRSLCHKSLGKPTNPLPNYFWCDN